MEVGASIHSALEAGDRNAAEFLEASRAYQRQAGEKKVLKKREVALLKELEHVMKERRQLDGSMAKKADVMCKAGKRMKMEFVTLRWLEPST
jgi:hypothetical protein